jgi:hypothetical protein
VLGCWLRFGSNDKAFARKVSRDYIVNGAAAQGLDLDEQIASCIDAMSRWRKSWFGGVDENVLMRVLRGKNKGAPHFSPLLRKWGRRWSFPTSRRETETLRPRSGQAMGHPAGPTFLVVPAIRKASHPATHNTKVSPIPLSNCFALLHLA